MATERTDDSYYGQILRRNIDRILARQGMKPTELYNAMAMSASSYSQMFKRGCRGPTMGMLTKIAEALGCELDELLRDA